MELALGWQLLNVGDGSVGLVRVLSPLVFACVCECVCVCVCVCETFHDEQDFF